MTVDLNIALDQIHHVDSPIVVLNELGMTYDDLFKMMRACFYDKETVQLCLGASYDRLRNTIERYLLPIPLSSKDSHLLAGDTLTRYRRRAKTVHFQIVENILDVPLPGYSPKILSAFRWLNQFATSPNLLTSVAIIDQTTQPSQIAAILNSREDAIQFYRSLIERDEDPKLKEYFNIVPDEFLFDCGWLYLFAKGTNFTYELMCDYPFAVYPRGYEFFYFDTGFTLTPDGFFTEDIKRFFYRGDYVNHDPIVFTHCDGSAIIYKGTTGLLCLRR